MSTRYRSIFVGLRPRLTPELAEALSDLRARIGEGCQRPSVVKPANYHFTLAFMGTPPATEAREGFARCAATLAGGQGPFDVEVVGVSCFGNRKLPVRVVFAEPAAHPRLDALGAAFRPLADRDPVFHLTLARARTRQDALWLKDNVIGERPMGRLRIDEVCLMANDGSGAYVDLASQML